MTGSSKNLVLHHRARQRAARALAESRLYAYYDALMGKPVPTEFKGLIAQLVAFEAGAEKSTERSGEILQLALRSPVRQS